MKKSKKEQLRLVATYLHEKQLSDNKAPANTLAEGNIVAYFDGACEPKNPGGNMGIGATIRCNGKEVFTHSQFVKAGPRNSNNVAEYMAFESILDFILKNAWQKRSFTIYGDSKLVINQMFSTWKMNGGFYIPFALRCKEKIKQVREAGNRINGIWIRREQNGYADELSKAELINNNVEFRIQPLSMDHSK